MREIQASEAQAHLDQFPDDGRAIAKIGSEVIRGQEEIDGAIASITALRKSNGKITFEELRSAREEGR
jgi:hypothetical protein